MQILTEMTQQSDPTTTSPTIRNIDESTSVQSNYLKPTSSYADLLGSYYEPPSYQSYQPSPLPLVPITNNVKNELPVNLFDQMCNIVPQQQPVLPPPTNDRYNPFRQGTVSWSQPKEEPKVEKVESGQFRDLESTAFSWFQKADQPVKTLAPKSPQPQVQYKPVVTQSTIVQSTMINPQPVMSQTSNQPVLSQSTIVPQISSVMQAKPVISNPIPQKAIQPIVPLQASFVVKTQPVVTPTISKPNIVPEQAQHSYKTETLITQNQPVTTQPSITVMQQPLVKIESEPTVSKSWITFEQQKVEKPKITQTIKAANVVATVPTSLQRPAQPKPVTNRPSSTGQTPRLNSSNQISRSNSVKGGKTSPIPELAKMDSSDAVALLRQKYLIKVHFYTSLF